jgi:hypothetical protein
MVQGHTGMLQEEAGELVHSPVPLNDVDSGPRVGVFARQLVVLIVYSKLGHLRIAGALCSRAPDLLVHEVSEVQVRLVVFAALESTVCGWTFVFDIRRLL